MCVSAVMQRAVVCYPNE